MWQHQASRQVARIVIANVGLSIVIENDEIVDHFVSIDCLAFAWGSKMEKACCLLSVCVRAIIRIAIRQLGLSSDCSSESGIDLTGVCGVSRLAKILSTTV